MTSSYQQRRALGTCTTCPAKAEPGRAQCRACLDADAERRANQRWSPEFSRGQRVRVVSWGTLDGTPADLELLPAVGSTGRVVGLAGRKYRIYNVEFTGYGVLQVNEAELEALGG